MTMASTTAGLPILTFHAIDEGRGPTSTAPALFVEILDALIGAGFRGVDLGEWVEAGRPAVDRGFALAFDDGMRSILGIADRLARLAVPATVFLVADRIGLDNDWPGQPPGIPRARLLDRSELERLGRLGFRFGSHGRTHARLDRLAPARLESELIGSRDRVEEQVGAACPLLAYPYGNSNPRVRAAASGVYRGAFGTRLAYATAGDGPFDVPRVDAYYLRTPGAVDRLISGRWGRRLAIRRALRAVRGSAAALAGA